MRVMERMKSARFAQLALPGYGVHVDVLHLVLAVYFLQAARMRHNDYPDVVVTPPRLETGQHRLDALGLTPYIDFLNTHMIHLDMHEVPPTPGNILHRADLIRLPVMMIRPPMSVGWKTRSVSGP